MSCKTNDQEFERQSQKISQFLQNVKHKLVVMSGKGDVGKSTVATNLAVLAGYAGQVMDSLTSQTKEVIILVFLSLFRLKLISVLFKLNDCKQNRLTMCGRTLLAAAHRKPLIGQ